MEQSTTIRYKCGPGPTGSCAPCAFTILTGSRRTERTTKRQDRGRRQRGRPDRRGGPEDRQTGGRPGTPEHFFQNPADDTVTTSLPIKDIPSIFFKRPFLKRGHCVLGWGPGTLLVCDPAGMTDWQFWADPNDSSLNPETESTQVKRFSCLHNVIFFSALITESCNWDSSLIQTDAKNSLF